SRRPSEVGQEEGGTEEPLGVHHALAEPAPRYTKRPNVFRLQTADCRLLLLQAPTAEEMLSWISRINLVASLFSSPPFPAAVGSQRRFVRPILPAAPSRSPPVSFCRCPTPSECQARGARRYPSSLPLPPRGQEEQLRSHEAWMQRVSQELLEHQSSLPEKRGRGRELDEYQQKEEFLLYE
ncbi:PSD4 protein, partial [Tricholaema leucomelas]|nr:PSD4 protein [Tricholaema leucomelas]